ncbi:MAG: host specificity factor TipJ family phage tail protein, partial [Rhodanobacter sp.]
MNALAPNTAPDLAPGNVGAVFMPAVNDPAGVRLMQVRAGQTLAEMLGEHAAHSLRVYVAGEEMPRVLWPQLRPKAGTTVTVEFYPQGGGGARKWILTIVAIVATIFSYGAASGAAWAAVGGLSATTVAIGGALIAGLALSMIPPPSANLGNTSSDPLDQLKSLTGTQNNANPYGAIPLVVGSWSYYPPHAAMPYTEISGEDQVLRMMLDLGLGDLDVSDITIGATDIASYQDVEWEVTKTPTLFTQDMFELSVAVPLVETNDTATRTTQSATKEISLDLVHGQGLYGIDKKGRTVAGATNYHVEYRLIGTGTWSNASAATGLTRSGDITSTPGSTFSVRSTKRKPLRLGIRWTVPEGQYDVRVTRGPTSWTGAQEGGHVGGEGIWSVLRSVSPQNPSTTGTTKLVIRIRATNQLSGVVSTLKVRVAQKIRRWDYDSQSFLAPVATRNPAWIYLWLLTECPGAVRHAALEQVELNAIARWAADCDANGYVYSGVADSSRVFRDVVKDVLACGLATPGMRNGKYSVVRDIAQTVAMQVYTPLNGTSLTYERSFASPPHALRVSFTNPQANGQQDERVVYWDGYDASNATHIEKLDLRNVTDPGAAWKIARYHLAVLWLRPNTYTQEVDAEYLINERGDLVEVASPMIGWGAGYGRIRALVGTKLTLAEPLIIESGKSYALRVRLGDAFSESRNITIAPSDIVGGKTSTVMLASAIAGMAVDQLYVVGEVSKLTLPVLITAIEPGSSMLKRTAKLTLVDSNPGVWTAASGTPPPFVSAITGTSWCAPPPPPVVHIRAGNDASNDAGLIKAVTGASAQQQGGIFRFAEPGRGGGCPTVDSPVRRVLEDGSVEVIRAGDVRVGDVLEGADPVTLERMTHV